MTRTLLAVLGLTFVSLSATSAWQDKAKDPPKFDAKAVFQKLDVNRDGKLSRQEFDPLMPKQPAEVKDKLFKLLDQDGDGFLTVQEFAKLSEIIAANQAKKGPPAETPAAFGPATAEQLAFFEKKIRPVLAAHCYQCHSAQAEKIKGKLVLDTRDGIRKGGESGPAVVPGNPKASLLIQAIAHADESLKMPPKEKLPDAVIADFVAWVKMGAPDPRDGPAAKAAYPEIDIKKGKRYWAFQPPTKALSPAVKDNAWPRSPIDRFLLAALEAKGMTPVADAQRSTLLRRVYLDLIGLPPTPEEIEAFAQDASDQAFEKVVDRLLASAHFGQRWGRHWLDVARYGETSGKQVNMNFPTAWRYRDYVIAAFNGDKPYRQFIKEQIAGDLLPFANEKQRAEQLIATGFLAIGPKDLNERNRLLFTLDVVDEQIDVTSQAFLGMTVSCARCHDHKFDPIPQQDYYALAGIFKSTQPLYGTIKLIQNQHATPLVALPPGAGLPAGLDPLTAAEKARLDAERNALLQQRDQLKKEGKTLPNMEVIFNNIKLAQLESKLGAYDADGKPRLQAMAVRDLAFADDCPLYIRGEVGKPGPKVRRGFLQVLADKQPVIARGSGRLELAEWLAGRDNPLTARVLVNRVWLHLFGRGLVATPDNFGAAGQPPSHPELLDYLAVSFMDEDAWSIKKLIRRVILSRAYQLSSQFQARNHEQDPDNVLVWRMSKQRLDAEALRDSILAVSGTLDRTAFPGSIVARVGEGYSNPVAKFAADGKFPFRSVYLPVVRSQTLEMLTLFDFPDPSLVMGQRTTTTVPAQTLFFLNNPWLIRQADAAASVLLRKDTTDSKRVRHAYLRFFGREATAGEIQAAEAFVQQYGQTVAGGGALTAQQRRQAWAAFCQALYGSAEFLYRN